MFHNQLLIFKIIINKNFLLKSCDIIFIFQILLLSLNCKLLKRKDMKTNSINKEKEAGRIVAVMAITIVASIILVAYLVSKFGVAHLM